MKLSSEITLFDLSAPLTYEEGIISEDIAIQPMSLSSQQSAQTLKYIYKIYICACICVSRNVWELLGYWRLVVGCMSLLQSSSCACLAVCLFGSLYDGFSWLSPSIALTSVEWTRKRHKRWTTVDSLMSLAVKSFDYISNCIGKFQSYSH